MSAIIIFDGVCNLCNASVDFVIRRDRKGYFQFTANQNETGRRILTEQGLDPDDVSTVFLYENGKLYRKSTAALRIARKLPFPWMLGYAFMIIPNFLRNIVYDFIARNRYKWMGKKETCRLPSPEEAARFV